MEKLVAALEKSLRQDIRTCMDDTGNEEAGGSQAAAFRRRSAIPRSGATTSKLEVKRDDLMGNIRRSDASKQRTT